MSTISDHAAAEALKSQSVTVDGQTIVRRSADDIIKLDQYQRAQGAPSNPWMGLRMRQIVPPGGG